MAFSPKAERIIDDFSKQKGVTGEHVQNLKDAIQSSPVLNEQFNYAANKGQLRGFQALPPDSGMGGAFNGGNNMISISLAQFSSANYQKEKGDNVFVLAHEIRHARNNRAMGKARADYEWDLWQEAKKPSPRDYTQEVRKMMDRHKWNEATAEIAGYNAVASMVKRENKDATLADIYERAKYRMGDFIELKGNQYTIKPNLTLNPDLTLSSNSRNIQGMAANYFDNEHITVGKGRVNYNHHYAAHEISKAVWQEREVHGKGGEPFRIDLKALGLDEARLERAGIFLKNPQERVPYHDLGGRRQGFFDHTYQTNRHVPAGQTTAPQPAEPAVSGPQITDMPAHARKLYGEIEAHLAGHQDGDKIRLLPEGGNVVAALAAAAYERNMPEVQRFGIKGDMVGIMYKSERTGAMQLYETRIEELAAVPQRESFGKIQDTEQARQMEEQRRMMEQQYSRGISR